MLLGAFLLRSRVTLRTLLMLAAALKIPKIDAMTERGSMGKFEQHKAHLEKATSSTDRAEGLTLTLLQSPPPNQNFSGVCYCNIVLPGYGKPFGRPPKNH